MGLPIMASQFEFADVTITFFCGVGKRQMVEITQGTRQIVMGVRDFNKAFNSRKVDAELLRRLTLENRRDE